MNDIERAWRKAEKYGLPEKTYHDCKKCLDTGLCSNCDGQGCMDCRYTGECQVCKDGPTRDADLDFIRNRAHERRDERRQDELIRNAAKEYEYNSLVNRD